MAPFTRLIAGEIPGRPPAFIHRPVVWDRAQALLDQAGIVAYVGGRGTGKTHLAAAQARTMAQDGQAIVWIAASSRNEIVAGYCRLAHGLGIAANEANEELVAELALAWLRQSGRSGLIVFDNAEDPVELANWIPTTGHFKVIITTTSRSFADIADVVVVGPFTDDEATAYLRTRTELGAAGAGAISAELGNLPLALAQAAAVIPLRGFSADDYIAHLRSTRLETALPKILGYPHALSQAIQLSLDLVQEVDRCGDLIAAISLLDPVGVSREIIALLETGLLLGRAPGSLTSELVRNSLLLWSETRESGLTHRVVSRVVREGLISREEIYGSLYWTIETLRHATLADSAESGWNAKLLEQSSWVFAYAAEVHQALADDQVEWILRVGNSIIVSSWKMGLLSSTFRCCEALSSLAIARLPGDTELSLQSQSRFVLALHGRGRFDAALDIGERLSERIVAALGADSSVALEHQAIQILVRLSCGDAAGAAELGRAASRTAEAARDAADPQLIQIQNSLGLALHELGLYDEEKALYVRALEACRNNLPPDHALIMHLENNLANVLRGLGSWRESADLHARVLESRKRVFGDLHPDTVLSMGNLASAMDEFGEHEQARRLHEEVVTAAETVYGPAHPLTLTARMNLASCYARLGRVEEALAMDQETLADRRRLLGHRHPSVLASMNNLALRYAAAGRPDDCLNLLRQVVGIREDSLGPEHPETMRSRSNLAHALLVSGNAAEAIDLERRTLEQRETVLGVNHPDTLLSMNNLANYYFSAGAMSEAGDLLERSADGMKRMNLRGHPHVFSTNSNLFAYYVSVGDRVAALRIAGRLALASEELDRMAATQDQRTFADFARRAVDDPGVIDTLIAAARPDSTEG